MTVPAGPVGLISNPNSGHNRDHFAGLQAQIAQSPAIIHVVTRNPSQIRPALQALAAQNIAVLAINGGDGTASAILGELLESGLFATPPLIVLLPGGTANMNAGDIGVQGSLRKAVSRFCAWCDSPARPTDNTEQRALLRVITDNSSKPQYGMFLGGGAIIHGTEYAHREIHSRGLRDDFSLAISTVRTVWGVLRNDPRFNRHVAITLRLNDGAPQSFDTLILAVSTLQRLAFGMRPFWSQEPGAIRLTIMEQGCTRFARTFFSIARGKPNRNAVADSGYRSHNADSMTLDMTGTVNLDGELLAVSHAVHIRASAPLTFLPL